MKTLMLATATALLTAPAFAQVPAGPAGAIAHFNGDLSGNARIELTEGSTDAYSTRTGLNEAQVRFNADYDSPNERRPITGGSVYSGTPSFGAEIHERIDAED